MDDNELELEVQQGPLVVARYRATVLQSRNAVTNLAPDETYLFGVIQLTRVVVVGLGKHIVDHIDVTLELATDSVAGHNLAHPIKEGLSLVQDRNALVHPSQLRVHRCDTRMSSRP